MESEPYVLVVEDDALTRHAIYRLLERAGHRVVCTSDGDEALNYLRRHPPPVVILLDLDLPVLCGRGFREHQRKLPALADVPVIAVSGEDDLANVADSLCLDGFLQKPFEPDALLQAVRHHGS